jgi:arsenate reductase
MPLKLYHYPSCDTCRRARKWLARHGVDVNAIDIVEHPPSATELRRVLSRTGLPVRKLFNTSGVSYRQGGYKDKLATMTDAEAIEALTKDGKLIKRPLLISTGARETVALVGFREAEYASELG